MIPVRVQGTETFDGETGRDWVEKNELKSVGAYERSLLTSKF